MMRVTPSEQERPTMPVERATDHPTFEIGGNAVTSLAAPARGSQEIALFRTDLQAGGGLPPHTHDHFDIFVVLEGDATCHLGDDTVELATGDSVVVPIGLRHHLEAGERGASIVVAMLGGTRMFRDDGSELVPTWVQ
jgi:quercetin dioxygenase-like cupin family protein